MLKRTLITLTAAAALALAAPALLGAQPQPPSGAIKPPIPKTTGSVGAASKSGYGTVNGLKMYYEIRGTGAPLVVLHGGLMTIEALGALLPALAEHHQVIAIELEGHGRTADLDRPLSYDQMAADVAGLLGQLGIPQADVFGFSMGGMTALRLAMTRPEVVRKLVVVSAPYSIDGFYPSIRAQWPQMSAQALAGTPMEQAYKQTAPNPAHWPVFIGKMSHLLSDFQGWPESDVKAIKAPVLLAIGDTDVIRPEYAVSMFRLLGGGSEDGGMSGSLPKSQLAVLPSTTHFNILYRVDLLMPIVSAFLDAAASTAAAPGAISR